MRQTFLLIVFFATTTAALHAQQVKKDNKVRKPAASKRLPIDAAATVLVISYTSQMKEPEIIDNTGHAISLASKTEREPGLIDTFGYKEVRELMVIPKERLPKLKEILYTLRCGKQPLKMYACYDPRNSILLLDNKGKVMAELQVCFECLGYHTVPEDTDVYDMRECKYDALKRFLVDVGIKYGTTPDRKE